MGSLTSTRKSVGFALGRWINGLSGGSVSRFFRLNSFAFEPSDSY